MELEQIIFIRKDGVNKILIVIISKILHLEIQIKVTESLKMKR